MRGIAALVLPLVVQLAPPAAWPASQQALGLDEMIDAADEIVVGTVVGNAARWQGKLVVTVSTVEVDESLKGESGRQIEITQLGGTAVHPVIGAPVAMSVSSFTALEPGERVVLFVDRRHPGVRQLVGAQQGKLVVRPDAAGTPIVAVGPKRLGRQPEGRDRVTIAAEPLSLAELRGRIRARQAEKKP